MMRDVNSTFLPWLMGTFASGSDLGVGVRNDDCAESAGRLGGFLAGIARVMTKDFVSFRMASKDPRKNFSRSVVSKTMMLFVFPLASSMMMSAFSTWKKHGLDSRMLAGTLCSVAWKRISFVVRTTRREFAERNLFLCGFWPNQSLFCPWLRARR